MARHWLLLCATALGACALPLTTALELKAQVSHDDLLQRRLLQTQDGPSYEFLIPYHGWFMTAAFGGAFPLGIALPIIFKGTSFWPILFHVHWLIQVVGALFMAAGLGMGAKLKVDDTPTHVHRAIGIGVFALVWFQILAGALIRPALHGRLRGLFYVSHWWVGRTALLVGIGNAFYGMNISQPATRFFIGFAVAIGGWLLVAFFGQLAIHATYRYTDRGYVILQPGKSEEPARYQNVIAPPPGLPMHNGALPPGTTQASNGLPA